jgi:nitroreductase
MRRRARKFYSLLDARRSVRQFAPAPVPRELIELAIATASTAPSGAHRQPWRFVAVSEPEIKLRIRLAAEAEERRSYEGGRLPVEWREALKPLGTDWHKPFLELAPWLVVVFEEIHGVSAAGRRQKNYYVKESVGIACGFFIVAVHQMGLATLPYTPSPMNFLSKILHRPAGERPYLLFPVGYPASDAQVPNLSRKSIAEVAIWNPGLAVPYSSLNR